MTEVKLLNLGRFRLVQDTNLPGNVYVKHSGGYIIGIYPDRKPRLAGVEVID